MSPFRLKKHGQAQSCKYRSNDMHEYSFSPKKSGYIKYQEKYALTNNGSKLEGL
jgi:hypothetical protein